MYDMVTKLFDKKPIYQPPSIRDLLDDLDGVYKSSQLDVYKPTSFIIDNVNDLKDNINTQAFKEEMTKPFIHEDMPLPHPQPIPQHTNIPLHPSLMIPPFHGKNKSCHKEHTSINKSSRIIRRLNMSRELIYSLELKVMANATKKGSQLLVDSIDQMQN
jgi:hypothetical protein